MKSTPQPTRIASLILSAASLLVFAACKEEVKDTSKHPNPPPAPAISSWPATQETDGGNFEVTLQPEGGEILRNQHFALELRLKPEDGDSTGITVAVDADMPAHQHGMNTKPEVSEIDGGGYRVEGMLFHMAGDWVISVDVTRNKKTERAAFPVSVE